MYMYIIMIVSKNPHPLPCYDHTQSELNLCNKCRLSSAWVSGLLITLTGQNTSTIVLPKRLQDGWSCMYLQENTHPTKHYWSIVIMFHSWDPIWSMLLQFGTYTALLKLLCWNVYKNFKVHNTMLDPVLRRRVTRCSNRLEFYSSIVCVCVGQIKMLDFAHDSHMPHLLTDTPLGKK